MTESFEPKDPRDDDEINPDDEPVVPDRDDGKFPAAEGGRDRLKVRSITAQAHEVNKITKPVLRVQVENEKARSSAFLDKIIKEKDLRKGDSVTLDKKSDIYVIEGFAKDRKVLLSPKPVNSSINVSPSRITKVPKIEDKK